MGSNPAPSQSVVVSLGKALLLSTWVINRKALRGALHCMNSAIQIDI